MNLLDRLERRFGRYAIPNVTLWIVAAQAFVYVLDNLPIGPAGQPANVLGWIALVPTLVLDGQPQEDLVRRAWCRRTRSSGGWSSTWWRRTDRRPATPSSAT